MLPHHKELFGEFKARNPGLKKHSSEGIIASKTPPPHLRETIFDRRIQSLPMTRRERKRLEKEKEQDVIGAAVAVITTGTNPPPPPGASVIQENSTAKSAKRDQRVGSPRQRLRAKALTTEDINDNVHDDDSFEDGIAEVMHPGAFQVGAREKSRIVGFESISWLQPQEDGRYSQALTTILEATKVQEDRLDEEEGSIEVVTAEKDSAWVFLKRSQCAQCALFVSCFVFVGLVLGISLAFFNRSMTKEDESRFFAQLGSTLDGHVIDGRFGSSLALNGDGTIMVTADVKDVFVYKLQEDVDNEMLDWVLTATIELSSPDGGTLRDNVRHANNVVLNSVEVHVSDDGNRIAIGLPYSTNEEGLDPGTGCVLVYQNYGNGRWEKIGNIICGLSSEDFFGTSVSLSANGQFLGVASPGNMGSAYVFQLIDTIWTQYGDIAGVFVGALAVNSISISSSGNVVAVGGYPQILESTSMAVARIFAFVAGSWIELGEGIPGKYVKETAYTAKLSGNGHIIALSNYYTGEYSPAEGEMNDALDVRAFEWDGSSWIQLGETMHGFLPGEKSGYFISLSKDGKMIFMGDPGKRSEEGGSDTGHIHMYRYNDEVLRWEQVGPNRYGDSTGDQFGSAVALSGDGKRFVASAPYNRGEGKELGRLYAFSFDGIDQLSN